MNVEKMNLESLNTEELASIDGGRRLPKVDWRKVQTKLEDTWNCVTEFCAGIWDGLTD